MSKAIYIVDGARTPFLKSRNRPGPFSASDLATAAGKSLLIRQGFAPQELDEVILGCAEATEKRPNTWINEEIVRLYEALCARGAAHSVECWHDGALVGGLYGVSLGAAFFGESMFSRKTDASKVALVHLVARLRLGGYRLLDTQFLTPHLAQFGGIEISRTRYRRLLAEALSYRAVFPSVLPEAAGDDPLALLQSSTLTS